MLCQQLNSHRPEGGGSEGSCKPPLFSPGPGLLWGLDRACHSYGCFKGCPIGCGTVQNLCTAASLPPSSPLALSPRLARGLLNGSLIAVVLSACTGEFFTSYNRGLYQGMTSLQLAKRHCHAHHLLLAVLLSRHKQTVPQITLHILGSSCFPSQWTLQSCFLQLPASFSASSILTVSLFILEQPAIQWSPNLFCCAPSTHNGISPHPPGSWGRECGWGQSHHWEPQLRLELQLKLWPGVWLGPRLRRERSWWQSRAGWHSLPIPCGGWPRTCHAPPEHLGGCTPEFGNYCCNHL